MMQLFGYPTQNTQKVLYVLEELNLPYEFQLVDLFNRENKKPHILKLNPIGKVPILVHDGKPLFESGAICRYLANFNESPLYPKDNYQRALVDQWMDFFSCHLGRWLSSLFHQKVLKPKMSKTPDPEACKEAENFISEQAKVIDHWLKGKSFLLGENLTIADLFAYAYIEQFKICNLSFKNYPNLKKWFETIEKRPSIAKGLEKIKHA